MGIQKMMGNYGGTAPKACGKTCRAWGAFPTDYRFTGERLEAGLGLYAMGARWYDPGLARWLSADTIVPEPGDPRSLNRYSWVLGNPLKFVDPTGHEEEGECGFADEACAGDPIYELYIALGIEDVMDFSTFVTYVWIASESYKSFQESGVFDEWVPAGMRFEGTGAILVGLDFNVDVVWNWNDFEGDLFVTVGWQVGLNAGISGNVGPLFTEGVYSLDDYTQINDHAGGPFQMMLF
ncbi:MAG: RHS repeat-associated core domain-containing protein [Candidatus Methanosuratincola sp.]